MAVSASVDLLEVLVQEIEEAQKEVHYYILVLSNAVDIYFLSKTFLKIIRKKLKVATDEELKTLNEIYVFSEEVSLWHTIFMLDSLLDSLSGKHFFAKWFFRKSRKYLAKALKEIQEKYMERFMDEEINNARYVLCEKQ